VQRAPETLPARRQTRSRAISPSALRRHYLPITEGECDG
jgi:hypothetical protein